MALTSLRSSHALRYAVPATARQLVAPKQQPLRSPHTSLRGKVTAPHALLPLPQPPFFKLPPGNSAAPTAPALAPPSQTWHLPRPSLDWIFPPQSTTGPSYEELEDRLRAAAHSPHIQDRGAFLDWFSKRASPHLRTEEAALQLLTKFAYLYLQPGNRVDLHIQRNLENQDENTYARRYHVSEVQVDKDLGLVGYMLEPGMLDTYKNHKRAIIVFRGTSMGPARDIMTCTFPTGLKPDVDAAGIGRRAFEANRTALQSWVRKCIQRGQQVTLTGHSLGGVVAARLLASLTPEEQAHCRVITYNAPGLDRDTQPAIVRRRGEIREVRNKADPVARAGQRHLPGVAYEYLVWDHFHVLAWLAQRELDQMPLDIQRYQEPYWGDTLAFIELGRRLFGMVAYDRVPA